MTAALAAGGRFGRRAALRGAGVALASQVLTRLTNSRLLPGEVRMAATSAFAAGAGLELPWAGGLLGAGAVLVSLADVRAGRTRPAVALGASCISAAVALGSTRVWPVAPREPADLRPAGGARRHRAANDGESVAVVLNPGAGSESGDSPADHLRQALPDARVVELDEGDDLLDALEEAAAGAGVLGAMGGDGTLNAAARVSHERGIPLLAIPGGTLNHFARDAGLESADDALAALAAGEVVAVDLASIDGHCFLNTASFGAYTELVDGRERLEGRIGKWPAMVTALVQVLRRSQPTEVEIDGRRRRLWLVFVRMSRVPWNFGGGPVMFRRLPPHHGMGL
jgi:undecaprenyl-diphosphatase